MILTSSWYDWNTVKKGVKSQVIHPFIQTSSWYDWNTVKQDVKSQVIHPSISMRGEVLKERNCSGRSKFLSLRVDPFGRTVSFRVAKRNSEGLPPFCLKMAEIGVVHVHMGGDNHRLVVNKKNLHKMLIIQQTLPNLAETFVIMFLTFRTLKCLICLKFLFACKFLEIILCCYAKWKWT